MAGNSSELRRVLGHFATGVTVVTCQDTTGQPHGAAVNAFTAVSLEPPLILISLGRHSKVCSLIRSRPFTVNVLKAEQKDLAMHFAGEPCRDIVWESGDPPRLLNALASIACAPWQCYDGGDHILYLGQVEQFRVEHGSPLLFYAGEFHRIGSAYRDA